MGQKVTVEHTVGGVIGMQREKCSWSYLVVEGEPPTADSGEDWHSESTLA